jgi:hypothetical protein
MNHAGQQSCQGVAQGRESERSALNLDQTDPGPEQGAESSIWPTGLGGSSWTGKATGSRALAHADC